MYDRMQESERPDFSLILFGFSEKLREIEDANYKVQNYQDYINKLHDTPSIRKNIDITRLDKINPYQEIENFLVNEISQDIIKITDTDVNKTTTLYQISNFSEELKVYAQKSLIYLFDDIKANNNASIIHYNDYIKVYNKFSNIKLYENYKNDLLNNEIKSNIIYIYA